MSREEQLRQVLITVRGNLISLMSAYPDRYPRHAFQGTYDLICENVGTPEDVAT